VNIWAGEFGDAYTLRNPATTEAIRAREKLWGQILNAMLPARLQSLIEFGANIGLNLLALQSLGISPDQCVATEPNETARAALRENFFYGQNSLHAWESAFEDADPRDLAFTSGVLIHIPPDELLAFCQDVHRMSSRWIVAIEYFSHEPQEVMYRGEMGRLWKRDFGAFYLDNFPDLHPIGCGFAWSRMTGLDDLTWWLMEKR
jgi:pseudaminic acid biosynthesis-associated methylase